MKSWVEWPHARQARVDFSEQPLSRDVPEVVSDSNYFDRIAWPGGGRLITDPATTDLACKALTMLGRGHEWEILDVYYHIHSPANSDECKQKSFKERQWHLECEMGKAHELLEDWLPGVKINLRAVGGRMIPILRAPNRWGRSWCSDARIRQEMLTWRQMMGHYDQLIWPGSMVPLVLDPNTRELAKRAIKYLMSVSSWHTFEVSTHYDCLALAPQYQGMDREGQHAVLLELVAEALAYVREWLPGVTLHGSVLMPESWHEVGSSSQKQCRVASVT